MPITAVQTEGLEQLLAEDGTQLLRFAALFLQDTAAAQEALQAAVTALVQQPQADRRTLLRLVVTSCRAWADAIPAGRLSASGIAEDMLAALARMPPRQRAAVLLREYLNLPETEVAAALRLPVWWVRRLLLTAQKR